MKVFYKRLLSIGIAVGVFCSLTVFSAGQTQWTAMKLRKKALESNIYKIINSPNPQRVIGMGLKFVNQIRDLLPDGVISDMKAVARNASVSYQDEPLPVDNVLGTDTTLAELMKLQIITGRYLSQDDMDHCKKVCVVKSNVYDLVKTRNATHIDINHEAYEIVGVVTGDEGTAGSWGHIGDIFVPITTFYKYIFKLDEQSGLILEIILDKGVLSSEEIWSDLCEKANQKGMDISGLKLMPYESHILEKEDAFIKEFFIVFLLSLLVLIIASFNIIHIATASMMDREREIGLRTAMGAKSYHIIRQITHEIVCCALVGGAGGVAAASIFNTLVNLGLSQFGLSFNVITIAAGILLATMAGLITSIIPAAKAAKLDPIAALREE